MNNHLRTRGRSPVRHSSLEVREAPSHLDAPGSFQCLLLRALELPKSYRDIFVLKDMQGLSMAEIAARLGITVEAAWARLKRARREIGSLQSSGHVERSQ